MRSLRLKTVLVRNVCDGVNYPIGSRETETTPNLHHLVFRAGVLECSLFLLGNSIAGFKSAIYTVFHMKLSVFSGLLTQNCIRQFRHYHCHISQLGLEHRRDWLVAQLQQRPKQRKKLQTIKKKLIPQSWLHWTLLITNSPISYWTRVKINQFSS